MKKNYFVFIVGAVLILTLSIFFMRPRKNMPVSYSLAPQATIAQPKESPAAAKTDSIPKQITKEKEQPVEEYFKEFTLPQDLKEELLIASKNGDVKDEWGEGKISEEELKEAGLAPVQSAKFEVDAKITNISAGYSIPDKAFAENLNNCLPDKAAEDAQNRILNSEALSAMGFSAVMEQKYEQAGKAFLALIRDYADTQAAPAVHLELARLMSEEGRFAEARQLVDKAISQYNNDKGYVTLAQALKKEIESDE